MKCPIENTIFSKFAMHMANLAYKWEDPPNGIANLNDIRNRILFLASECLS